MTDDAGLLPPGSPGRVATSIGGARVDVVEGNEKGRFVVSVLNGPNAGRVAMTSETGVYRFDDMASLAGLDLEFSKAGYRTDRAVVSELLWNTHKPWTLTPNSDRTP